MRDDLVVIVPSDHRIRVEIARTRRERRRGLLGASSLSSDRALLLLRTRSVHTFGMRFAIQVVLLDETFRVLDVRVMPPGRLLLPRVRVRHVLECVVGADVRVGERLIRYETSSRVRP